MVIHDFEPIDVQRALVMLSNGWSLQANYCGRWMPVVSVDTNGYLLEHWEQLWVRAEDVTAMRAFKYRWQVMRAVLPCSKE